MTTLTPLIELATQKSLDLFFRLGQGYVARTNDTFGQRQAGVGLTPWGVQSRAEIRIVMSLPHPAPSSQMNAWPEGPNRPRSPAPLR